MLGLRLIVFWKAWGLTSLRCKLKRVISGSQRIDLIIFGQFFCYPKVVAPPCYHSQQCLGIPVALHPQQHLPLRSHFSSFYEQAYGLNFLSGTLQVYSLLKRSFSFTSVFLLKNIWKETIFRSKHVIMGDDIVNSGTGLDKVEGGKLRSNMQMYRKEPKARSRMKHIVGLG